MFTILRAWNRRKHLVFLVIGVGLLWLGGPSNTRAQVSLPNFIIRSWFAEEGLPQNKVTAVVQTHDGYLWVGTYNGLARFDGVRFAVFDDNNTPELRSRRITSLFEAEDGTLWIGTESGDISKFKDGQFAAVQLNANWKGGKIFAITADNLGDVWVLNESGELARVRDGKVQAPSSGTVAKVFSLARALDGTVWVESEGAVSALQNGQLSGEVFTNLYVQGFCAARDGGFWVARGGGIQKWKDGEWLADLGVAPWGWRVVVNFMETSSGVLVAGTSDAGLWFVFPDDTNAPALHFTHTNGLPSDWVTSLCEDRERNLWCGTGAGLVLLRPSNIETVSPPDGWRGSPVLSVLPTADGALWIGTEGSGLYRRQNGNWTNFDAPQGLHNPYVWSLATDGAGKVWTGTWGGGVFKQTGDGFEFGPGLESFLLPAPALLFLDDVLWIGTPMGAVRYQDGKFDRFNEIAGQPFGDVRSIRRDSSGAMWFGTAGDGLVWWLDGNVRRFKKDDGLSSNFIECLHLASDGALWIGTFGGGLNRFKDGKISTINHEQGLPNGVIGYIESDGRGFLWMSSFGGILRASEKELNLCANGQIARVPFLTYGVNDGLPTLECSEGTQSAGAKSADGRLWFPTAKGLVAIDPASVMQNTLPPPVRIEEMRVDDQVVQNENGEWKMKNGAAGPSSIFHPSAAVVIPPGRHRIEFEYTGLSFVAPEKVRFKCRLEGFEPDWSDVGTERVAVYNYIPPGSYSFQVTACNNDGVWNETGASLKFEVLPFFWQTTWFHVLGGVVTALAAGGAVWLDTRRRMRRKLERLERQRALERERARIARDIHDDLGASLTRITMLSQVAHEAEPEPARAIASLDQIFGTARELTRSMDEIVWAVNPKHDTLESLASYLGKFTQDYLRAVHLRCRLDVPMHLPALVLTSEVRHNLFLAVKEALHNVVKHAEATVVRITLSLADGSFAWEVQDNGRGFDARAGGGGSAGNANRLASGNGLANMRRRLADVGGSCEVQSTPGAGTRVRFVVPVKATVS